MYAFCPDCRSCIHLRIDSKIYASDQAWLKERYPNHNPNEVLLHRCYPCNQMHERDQIVLKSA